MAQRQFRTDDTSLWLDRFGNGSDGPITISGDTAFSTTYQSCSGTDGGTTLTLAAAGSFSNGQLIIIHQSYGASDAGKWELNKIASGAGTTTLTLAYPLTRTYVDSGSDQAQVMAMPQYTDVTVNNGVTWSMPTWNGNTGGIIGFFATGTVTITGTLSGASAGFRGAAYSGNNDVHGWRGEGYTQGPNDSRSASANTVGGGGGRSGALQGGSGGGGGAGGGHANTGNSGGGGGSHGSGGTGGTAGIDNASLTIAHFGGGAGGGSHQYSNGDGGAGGTGGGLIIIIAKNIVVTGSITTSGQNGFAGTDGDSGGGGGGAGGALLIKGQSVNIGTNLVVSAGGTAAGGTGSGAFGGNGSVGRIHIDYSDSLTGSSSTPSLDSSVDAILANLPAQDSYGFFM